MTSNPTPPGQDQYGPVPGGDPYLGQAYQGQEFQGQAYPGQAYQQQMPGVPPQGVYSQKSKMAAGLLAIFLGALGIHNFYLGHTGRAVAQLLISVLSFGILSWVSWIWAIIEGVLIFSAQPGQQPWGVDANGYPLQP
ncbi:MULTISPECIES: TM2 domain-containing protein [Actinomyces]|uniref:TM2 domain-containing protein n=1 Tax=Actinomyces respiraculi TaxID=2744574 RepID=A0A7T0LKC3_9ACTO|nr:MULTISPECIES: TM2 domain-containing protein [Actinomyces]QPL05202.1 TM2 domain-containing protein [Actinomyces respiraculi]